MVSTRLYPQVVKVVAGDAVVAEHERRNDEGKTQYDWQHYIPLLQRKPGALRNGAPFADLPEPLQQLRQALLRESGGDRVMAQVLVRQTSTVHTGQGKGQDIRYTYYANGYIQSATDVSAGTRSEYGYDAAGNRVSEGYYQWDGSARIASVSVPRTHPSEPLARPDASCYAVTASAQPG